MIIVIYGVKWLKLNNLHMNVINSYRSAWVVYDMERCLNSLGRGIMEEGFECSLSHF